jgi:succinyl-CoA synthetase beta subunit
MRLYEFEGKMLLAKHGISVPEPYKVQPLSEISWEYPSVLKAQVLFGNRADQGLIQLVKSADELEAKKTILAEALTRVLPNPDETLILVEPLMDFSSEWYLALRYDTDYRQLVLWFSAGGGSGIEERASSQDFIKIPLLEFNQTPVTELLPQIPLSWLKQIIKLFLKEDLSLLEINPLIQINDHEFNEHAPNGFKPNGQLIALDAKIELDDNAAFRHPDWENLYPPRSLFARPPTTAEQAAKKINALDHRGTAGAAYFDFDGEIAVLGSGGGASILAMDTLLTTSLKPANYTEYSGNPSRAKVAALTELVLSKPNLKGLWVIGGHANFTDQFETLMGVMDGLEKAKLPPKFPVVIRRGGPRLEEAFAALRERAQPLNLNLQLFSSDIPIADTAKILETAVQTMGNSAI